MDNSALPVEVPPGRTATFEVWVQMADAKSGIDENARFYTSLPEKPWFDVRVRKNRAGAE